MSSNSLIILSYAARRELIESVAPLYREASLAQKGLVLDRMVAMTGYARTYAIHLTTLLLASVPSTVTVSLAMAPRYSMP